MKLSGEGPGSGDSKNFKNTDLQSAETLLQDKANLGRDNERAYKNKGRPREVAKLPPIQTSVNFF